MSITSCQASSSIRSIRPSRVTPALLTRTWIRWDFASISSTTRWTSAESATLAAYPSAVPPASRIACERRFQAFQRPGHAGDGRAAGGQLDRDRPADAARGAGHQRHLARQIDATARGALRSVPRP